MQIRNCALILTVLILHALGCTRYVPVSGTITLDDAPLRDAYISFAPEQGAGDILIGATDDQGDYALSQTGTSQGIVAGQYLVRITTYREGNPNADPPVPPVAERVPARYNLKSELFADIDRENTVHDFQLKSDKPRAGN